MIFYRHGVVLPVLDSSTPLLHPWDYKFSFIMMSPPASRNPGRSRRKGKYDHTNYDFGYIRKIFPTQFDPGMCIYTKSCLRTLTLFLVVRHADTCDVVLVGSSTFFFNLIYDFSQVVKSL